MSSPTIQLYLLVGLPSLIELYRQLQLSTKPATSKLPAHHPGPHQDRAVRASFTAAAVTFLAMTVFGFGYMILAAVMAVHQYTPENTAQRVYVDALVNLHLTADLPGMVACTFALARSVAQYRQHTRAKVADGKQGGMQIRVEEEVVITVELGTGGGPRVETLHIKCHPGGEEEVATGGTSGARASA